MKHTSLNPAVFILIGNLDFLSVVENTGYSYPSKRPSSSSASTEKKR